jgi:hypothetical protein
MRLVPPFGYPGPLRLLPTGLHPTPEMLLELENPRVFGDAVISDELERRKGDLPAAAAAHVDAFPRRQVQKRGIGCGALGHCRA